VQRPFLADQEPAILHCGVIKKQHRQALFHYVGCTEAAEASIGYYAPLFSSLDNGKKRGWKKHENQRSKVDRMSEGVGGHGWGVETGQTRREQSTTGYYLQEYVAKKPHRTPTAVKQQVEECCPPPDGHPALAYQHLVEVHEDEEEEADDIGGYPN
jgi:hypothetical protein